ncbi:MAG TPA: EamA family transporter [Gemmatimonadaceae bacterium]|nr:EamA family transporter [Gemmatimonadaceae bacterium]
MGAVILSAALHAIWNFLLRRAGGNSTVVALSKVAEGLLLLPLAAAVFLSSGTLPLREFVPAIVVAAILALANYAALTAAYRRADLSLVYPVARGGVFLFLPLLGFLVFDERLDATGWLALALIVGGIVFLPLRAFTRSSLGEMGRHLRERFIGYALLAAAATAAYTVWDKYSVGHLDMVLYFYGYTLLLAIWFSLMLARTSRAEVREQLRKHPVSIVMIGLLNAGAYMLVLIALRNEMATQVLAVRQLSIPMGVFLGWRLLHEHLTPPRIVGSALITSGCLLAAAL